MVSLDCTCWSYKTFCCRKHVCFSIYIDKTWCVWDILRNMDTQIIRTLRHVPLVFILTGFHCIVNPRFGPSYEQSTSVSNIQIPRLDTRQCWKVTRFFLAKPCSPHSLFLHVTITSKVWKSNVRLRSIGHFFLWVRFCSIAFANRTQSFD